MKDKDSILLIIFFLSFFIKLQAQEIEIKSSKIQYDDTNKITVFEGNVSSYDEKGNKIFSEYAQYNKTEEIIKTKGKTKIVTSGGYEVYSSNIVFNNKKNIIFSNNETEIIDKDGNKIFAEMFNYSILKNIFFSKGKIKINDIKNNNYNFTEIYIDENKKKIVGSDVKAFLNQTDILANLDNEPRFFANTMSFSDNKNTFDKGVFTYCKNRENEKCPPWTLKSKKIMHDLTKKTIYYDNVVLKIYDFPIFFSPKFSHPDPTVDRRSGLLTPSLSNSTTLSSGLSAPYFWNINKDKDLTLTPKFFLNENPLMLAEYRQDFANSFITLDAGYTRGYKKKNNLKSDGGRAHFFSNFYKRLIDEEDKSSNLEINIEKVSNDTYFKVYDIDTALVKKEDSVLENKVEFVYQNKDFFFGLTPSAFEDTNKLDHLRHEYLLPLTVEKNVMYSDKFGMLDYSSNLKLRNYEVNKHINLLVNDFKWKSKKWLNSTGVESYFQGLIKNVNYDADNTNEYKNEDNNHEIHSALGYLAKLNLFKEDLINNNLQSLTPKFLLRYAPGHMRNASSAQNKLNYGNLFKLNKVNELDVLEPGLSTSVGFEYKKNKLDNKNITSDEIFSLSVGQVISAEENKDIPSSTSLDQRFSDIVGTGQYTINKRSNLNYNFSIDQGYKNFNYNEIGADFGLGAAKFNLNYLQEKNHIGDQEYIKTGFDLGINKSSEITFNTKRNLLTNSAEFYNLSYNYINDCLKAGIAYRREFYTDRDIEPANKLMFTISIIPFSSINTPGISK